MTKNRQIREMEDCLGMLCALEDRAIHRGDNEKARDWMQQINGALYMAARVGLLTQQERTLRTAEMRAKYVNIFGE